LAEDNQTRPAGSPWVDRHREWLQVLAVAAAVLLLKVGLSYQFHGPWYEPDGSTYALRGYHLAQGDGLGWRHSTRPAGAAGYPILLTIPWFLAGEDTDLFIRLTLVMNSLLAAGIVVVGYAALRRWFSHWASLVGAIGMAVYGPIFIYGFAFLSETSFFFLFVLAVFLAQRAAESRKWYWWFLLGLTVAASMATRVTGFAFVAAAVVVAVIELIQRPNATAVLRIVVCLAGIALVLLPLNHFNQPQPEVKRHIGIQLIAGNLKAKPPPTQADGAAPQHVYDYAPSRQEHLNLARRLLTDFGAMAQIVRILTWAVGYIILSSFAMPVVLAVRFVLKRWRSESSSGGRRIDPGIMFVVLAGLFTIGGVVLRLGMSQQTTMESMYGRYLDVIVMVIVGVGAAYLFDGLSFSERVFSWGRGPTAKAERRARKKGDQVPLSLQGAPWPVLFAVAFVLTVAAVWSLPNCQIIFSANLGINWAAQTGKHLAAWYGFHKPNTGAAMIGMLLCPVLFGLSYLARRRPHASATVLMVLIAIGCGIAYHQTLAFTARNDAAAYHRFSSQAAEALDRHFKGYKRLERVVLVDSPPKKGKVIDERINIKHSVCSLELFNRDVQFQGFKGTMTILAGTPIYSLRDQEFPELIRAGSQCIYLARNPPRSGPKPSGRPKPSQGGLSKSTPVRPSVQDKSREQAGARD